MTQVTLFNITKEKNKKSVDGTVGKKTASSESGTGRNLWNCVSGVDLAFLGHNL